MRGLFRYRVELSRTEQNILLSTTVLTRGSHTRLLFFLPVRLLLFFRSLLGHISLSHLWLFYSSLLQAHFTLKSISTRCLI